MKNKHEQLLTDVVKHIGEVPSAKECLYFLIATDQPITNREERFIKAKELEEELIVYLDYKWEMEEELNKPEGFSSGMFKAVMTSSEIYKIRQRMKAEYLDCGTELSHLNAIISDQTPLGKVFIGFLYWDAPAPEKCTMDVLSLENGLQDLLRQPKLS